MKLPSAKRGRSAVESSVSSVVEEVVAEHRDVRPDEEAMELSTDDWNGMHRTIWRMKLWRAYPSRSVPVEALRLIMKPKW
eukprot:7144067-Pyramimonas_sp.AAC.1